MKMGLRKLSISVFVLLALMFMMSSGAIAALETPYFSYNGNFNYVYDDVYQTGTLTTSITTIPMIVYKDGTYGFFGDPLIGGNFTLGTLYNDVNANSLVFGSTPGAGSVSFSLDNGTTNFMNASLDNFSVTVDEFGPRLNPGYDMNNITGISTVSGTSSKFIDDVNSFTSPVGNLYIDFNVTDGSSDFTADSSGTITGEFSVVAAVAPEPVSSTLFILGGVTLGIRSYRRKIK